MSADKGVLSRVAKILGVGALALAAALIVPSEGRRLDPYRDTGGVLTVCDGHTGGVQARRYTPGECDQLLASDIRKHDSDISKCIPAGLPDRPHAAFLSFAYNVGAPTFCKSTMSKKARAGDIPGACAEISRFVFVAGRDCRLKSSNCAGIVKRREKERAMCEGVNQP